MRRVAGSGIIISLIIFLLGLPLLHLHPVSSHTSSAVIHCHLPHTPGVHRGSSEVGPIVDDGDSDGIRAVPFEIPSLSAASEAQAPVPGFSATLAISLPMEPDTAGEPVAEPRPRAKAPPGVLIRLSFRSPPA